MSEELQIPFDIPFEQKEERSSLITNIAPEIREDQVDTNNLNDSPNNPKTDKQTTYIVTDDSYRHLGETGNFTEDVPTKHFDSPKEAVVAAYNSRQINSVDLEGTDLHVHKVDNGEVVFKPNFRTVDQPALIEHSWKNISDSPFPKELRELAKPVEYDHISQDDNSRLATGNPDKANLVIADKNGRLLNEQGSFESSKPPAVYSSPESSMEAAYKMRDIHASELDGGQLYVHRQINDEVNHKPVLSTVDTKSELTNMWEKQVGGKVPEKISEMIEPNKHNSHQLNGTDLMEARSYNISLTEKGANKALSTTDVALPLDLDKEQTKKALSEKVAALANSSGHELSAVTARVTQQKNVTIDNNLKELKSEKILERDHGSGF